MPSLTNKSLYVRVLGRKKLIALLPIFVRSFPVPAMFSLSNTAPWFGSVPIVQGVLAYASTIAPPAGSVQTAELVPPDPLSIAQLKLGVVSVAVILAIDVLAAAIKVCAVSSRDKTTKSPRPGGPDGDQLPAVDQAAPEAPFQV
jgi:hypothetical protein